MKPKNCLIFGASGQIGRTLIRGLTKKNLKVTAVTRNLHQKGYVLKTQGNPGYLDVVETSIFNLEKIEELIKKADVCINLVGILFEKGPNNFNNIHEKFPNILAELCKKYRTSKFIHLSALGIENAVNSKYASSKLKGEIAVREKFKDAIILKPSIVYSVDDNFTTMLMGLLNLSPIFPLYYGGKTKFMPLHCIDLCNLILDLIEKDINIIKNKTIEVVGPEELTFKQIVEKLLKLIEKKRLFIPVPIFIANMMATFFQILPKPLITKDQIKLLYYHNVPSGKYKTNFDIGKNFKLNFEEEVEKYCYTWKETGQYAKKNTD
tara:strand:+ start:41 stop:1003 length:963 start_codon:yes stop_codon:yes gene_type:complete